MLNITVGRSGTGKTYSMFGKISQLIKNGADNVCLLVPDQFSFEAERIIVLLCGSSAVNKVKVFGFNRLATEILSEFGGVCGINIDDATRKVIMKRAVRSVKEQLRLYSKTCETDSFINELLFTVTELKQADVDPIELTRNPAVNCHEKLSDKLYDISVIGEAYDAIVKNTFIDGEDLLLYAYEKAKDKDFFRDKVFFVDGFDGFSGLQFKLLKLIIKGSTESNFYFTCNDKDFYTDKSSYFSGVKKAVCSVMSLAKEFGVPISEPILLKERRNGNSDLAVYEKIASGENLPPDTRKAENITLCCADSPTDECEFVAKQIRRLVREGGFRYKDIIVVAGDKDGYQRAIDETMKRYGIPCYIDERVPADELVLPIYISALLKCAVSFSTENVLRMLKTALAGLSVEEVAELENYCYVWGIEGDDWKHEWNMNPSGLNSQRENVDFSEELEHLNLLRKTAIKDIIKLTEIGKSSINDYIKTVYRIMCNTAKPSLKIILDNLKNDVSGDAFISAETDSWDAVVGGFDRLFLCFSNCKVDVKDVSDAFDTYIGSLTIGEIPQSIDQVQFGSADRIRPRYPKAVFLVGVNQGVFPKFVKSGGILSIADRARLNVAGVNIDNRTDDAYIDENYRFYCVSTCASEKLFLSYSILNAKHETAEPASIITKILMTFENDILMRESYYNRITENDIQAKLPAFQKMSVNWGENNIVVNTLKSLFENDREFSKKLQSLKSVTAGKSFSISPDSALKLYGNNLRFSASKVDTFYNCPFSFFCRFGLKAEKPQRAELSPMIKGTVVHSVLESVISKHKNDLGTLTDDIVKKEVDAAIDAYFESIQINKAALPADFLYALRYVTENLYELIKRINDEFSQSEFKVIGCEISIKNGGDIPAVTVPVSEDKKITLTGSVDRADAYNDGRHLYIRIIDYKTGKKVFRLSDTLAGLNLQMLIYLCAIIRCYGANAEPAGILYLNAFKKITDNKDDSFKTNGILTNNIEVLKKMTDDLSNKYIPVKIKKTGGFDKRVSKVIPDGAFDLLFGNVERHLKNMGQSLFSGEIKAAPLGENACKFCDYSALCLRSPDLPVRPLETFSDEETIEILKREEEENNGVQSN